MKIGIDISQMCYEGTGVARYTRELTGALLKEHPNHVFTLLAGAWRQKEFFTQIHSQQPWSTAKLRLYGLPPKLAGLVLNTVPVPFEWIGGRYDVFHASDWVQPITSMKTVTTVHDLVFRKYPETVDLLIRKVQEFRLSRIAKGSVHVIVDSMSTKNDLKKIYAIDDERIDVIYPGINSTWKPATKKEIERVKTKYTLPDQYILSVGTQEPRKNIARLAAAAEKVRLPLVLVGHYGWGDSLTPGVKSAHTPGMLSLGHVPDADLSALYTGAAVFAYPSLYEGFGFPVLEAKACGTPVVTSNVSSLPEVGGESAVLVSPTDVDAIAAGIQHAIQEREKRIDRGFTEVKSFTWDSAAKATLEVYEKISKGYI